MSSPPEEDRESRRRRKKNKVKNFNILRENRWTFESFFKVREVSVKEGWKKKLTKKLKTEKDQDEERK